MLFPAVDRAQASIAVGALRPRTRVHSFLLDAGKGRARSQFVAVVPFAIAVNRGRLRQIAAEKNFQCSMGDKRRRFDILRAVFSIRPVLIRD